MTKKEYTIAGIVAVCVLFLATILWTNTQKGQPNNETDHEETVVEGENAGHFVTLSEQDILEFGITLDTVKLGNVHHAITLPGEIVLNTDRVSRVVPPVSGIASEVRATEGDYVKAGQIIAVLESRELAEAKAAYSTALEKETLAKEMYTREERLWEKKISSKQEYLTARQNYTKARIAKRSAEQQLRALGLSNAMIEKSVTNPNENYTRFDLRAPFSGTIIGRNVTRGERVGTESPIFTIANLSTVWLDIDVYPKDIPNIQKGQTVDIEIGDGIPSVTGEISWIAPHVDETTRTVKARVVLPNKEGNLRPGMFVNAQVLVERSTPSIVIPQSAVQVFDDTTVVFVHSDKGFEPTPVAIGEQNADIAEIISGLTVDQLYARTGAFTLKAQLSKSAFDDGHNH